MTRKFKQPLGSENSVTSYENIFLLFIIWSPLITNITDPSAHCYSAGNLQLLYHDWWSSASSIADGSNSLLSWLKGMNKMQNNAGSRHPAIKS